MKPDAFLRDFLRALVAPDPERPFAPEDEFDRKSAHSRRLALRHCDRLITIDVPPHRLTWLLRLFRAADVSPEEGMLLRGLASGETLPAIARSLSMRGSDARAAWRRLRRRLRRFAALDPLFDFPDVYLAETRRGRVPVSPPRPGRRGMDRAPAR